MTKRELNLETFKGDCFLSKEAFKHDLTIAEIRLLVVLTSTYKKKLDDLNYDQKLWIAGSKSVYSKLKSYEDNLIKLCLINSDGTGLKLERDYIIYKDADIIVKCKNMRQLFLSSLNLWHKKGKVIISEDMFYNLFGKTTSRINENWKRTCDQLGVSCTWTEKNNNIYIEKTESAKKEGLSNNPVNETVAPQCPLDVNNSQLPNEPKEASIEDLEKTFGNIDRDMMFIRNIGSKRDTCAPMPMFCTEEELNKYFG